MYVCVVNVCLCDPQGLAGVINVCLFVWLMYVCLCDPQGLAVVVLRWTLLVWIWPPRSWTVLLTPPLARTSCSLKTATNGFTKTRTTVRHTHTHHTHTHTLFSYRLCTYSPSFHALFLFFMLPFSLSHTHTPTDFPRGLFVLLDKCCEILMFTKFNSTWLSQCVPLLSARLHCKQATCKQYIP